MCPPNQADAGCVTLHDVAKAAGVSHTTVSWALRDDPRISAATRERVLEAAARLGYVPNDAARCLATGKTATIAIVSASFSAAFESETLRGIEAEMCEAHPGHALVQYSTGCHEGRAAAIFGQLLRGNRADGVICLGDPPPAELRAAFREAGRPLVVFDEQIDDCSSIRGDSLTGGRLATGLLLDAGCRRPGIVTSLGSEAGEPHCDPARLRVFRELCRERGLDAPSAAVGEYHFESGRAVAGRIIAEAWDGVFCAAGDMVAMGILAGFREAGVAVPGRVRLVGYDNLLVSGLVDPALTTVAQPLELMGREAVRSCFALMEAGPGAAPIHKSFTPTLIRRASA